MEKISVIIPVYNCADYLPRCLNSILNNTYKELEIICVDDGSTDSSLSIMKEFAEKDSRICVVHQKNGGASSARNTGLRRAGGSYVAFIDVDDWVHSQYFEILYTYMEKHNADIVMCDWKHVNGNDDVKDETVNQSISHQWFYTGNIKSNFIYRYVWGKLYRKEILENQEFSTDLSYSEDKAFNISVFGNMENAKVLYVQHQLYYYFSSRPDSAINTTGVAKKKEVILWYLRKSEKSSGSAKVDFLTEGFKMFLSLRCYNGNTPAFTKPEQKSLLCYGLKCLASTPNYPLLWRIMFEIQGRLPFTYNFLRKNKIVKKIIKSR